jgi:CPA2 family monovalent cation:H+ antiporter-2
MLLTEIGVVLILLALLARLAARTAFSAIPLYLVAGLGFAAFAPHDISPDIVEMGTQVAVILLLFMLGLEYSVGEILGSLRSSYVAGIVDAALNFPPGFLVGLALGWDLMLCVVMGGVTYISSSGTVAKMLDDLGRLANRETPSILAILVIEDLVMAPYLPFVAVLLVGGTILAGIGSALAATALAAFALFVAHRYSARLSRRLVHPKSEVVLLSVMGLLLAAGGVAELLHVSGAVVAFLVGLSISGPIAQRARELLGPMRDLFAAFFFVAFGYSVDVAEIPDVLAVAVALAVVTAATKLVTGWVAARTSSGVAGRLRAGTALVARGEFSVVIVGLALAAGTETAVAPLAATYVLFTAVSAPLLTRLVAHGLPWRRQQPAERARASMPAQSERTELPS